MRRAKSTRESSSYCSSSECDLSPLGACGEGFQRLAVHLLPPTKPDFYEARLLGTQFFVRTILELRYSIFNHGFKIAAANPKDTDKVDEWALDPDNARFCSDFARETWLEYLAVQNAIAIWRNTSKVPLIWPPENCNYREKWGMESIIIAPGLSSDEIQKMPGLSSAEKAALSKSDIELQKQGTKNLNPVFSFDVVKNNRRGAGLAMPDLKSVIDAGHTLQSIQMADRVLADSMRTVMELHKLGHEIKNGPHAGEPRHFIKKARSDAEKKALANPKRLAARLLRMWVNFDHVIEWPRPDNKNFKWERAESAMAQLLWWSAPIGQMIMAQTVNPFLTQLLRAQGLAARSHVGAFIGNVLTKTSGVPKPVVVTFDDDVFMDTRIMTENLKTGLASGPLSQETWLKKTGISSAAHERPKKTIEAKLPKGQTRPVFDAAHGDQKPGGRPAGTPDAK